MTVNICLLVIITETNVVNYDITIVRYAFVKIKPKCLILRLVDVQLSVRLKTQDRLKWSVKKRIRIVDYGFTDRCKADYGKLEVLEAEGNANYSNKVCQCKKEVSYC